MNTTVNNATANFQSKQVYEQHTKYIFTISFSTLLRTHLENDDNENSKAANYNSIGKFSKNVKLECRQKRTVKLRINSIKFQH